MSYSHAGVPEDDAAKSSDLHQGPGTSVKIANLFQDVPVRREMALENAADACKTIYNLFIVYALAYPTCALRLHCSPLAPFQCVAHTSLRERVTELFGPTLWSELHPFAFGDDTRLWRVEGLLAAPDMRAYKTSVRSKNDRSFVYLK
jgi:DNA mismatch repair ATPase MutL